MAEERAKVRVVRCPKCDKLLPELANFTVYRCGGCNATLQAKKSSAASEASSERSDGENVKCFENADVYAEKTAVVVSDASSEVKPEGESVDVSGGEKKKLALKESPISICTSAARSEKGDDMKEPEILKLNESPSGDKGGDGKYLPHSETPLNVPNAIVDDLDHENVEEVQETKMQVEHSNGKQSWRSREKDMSSAFRRPNPYPDEGPSNYHHNPAKRKNLDGPSSTEHIDQDRAEILKKLDELRDQLRRSCEISQKPKARPSACRTTTFSSNPYARNGRNNWFPEGSSLLNRTSSRHSPFMNGHGIDLPNLYPAVPSQNGIPGYRDVYGPHSFGRAPFHPAGQYPRPMGNCLHGQFDPDPLVSYHHDGFYHQPACSCLHCCNSHWPSVYSNQRVPYPVSNHGFYQADGPSVLGQQNYNQRDANGPLSSNEPRYRQRPMFMKKDGRTCRPVAGAAPFVSCSNCSELLQVPEDTLRLGKSRHKLRCGSCSHLISLDYDGGKLVTSAPPQATNVDSENNKDSNNGNNGHMNRHSANSYPGSFDSTGYEGHSEDEKLVLPSYPVSSNEMIEKGYCFHLSEAEKMQGLSSSPSFSEDLDSQDSVVCQRDVPSSSELPPEARGLSRVPSLPLREHFGYSLSSEVVDGPGNGSRSRRSDQEKIVSTNGNFKQNSVKDVPVASEMDLSSDEYPDAGFSQESWEACRDEDQPRAKNSKSGESFFAGLIKKSFKFNQSTENSRCKVFINGHAISDRLVKKAEKLAGPIQPGNYWYDYRAGFWGVTGHACLGIIPPFIEEFNFPMPKNCAGGNTGVFVNGRELHQNDLALLSGRGLPDTEGQSYIIEISGKVWDEATGEELDSLGKLAPTIEKVKHGFGMRVPRVAA